MGEHDHIDRFAGRKKPSKPGAKLLTVGVPKRRSPGPETALYQAHVRELWGGFAPTSSGARPTTPPPRPKSQTVKPTF